jgi:F-type H+-transporting ATPase subunit alpha
MQKFFFCHKLKNKIYPISRRNFCNEKIRTNNVDEKMGTVLRPFPNLSNLSSILVYGLSPVRLGEEVNIFQEPSGSSPLVPVSKGIALEIKSEGVLVGLMNKKEIGYGFAVKSTGYPLMIPVGENLLGRIVDPLGVPLDEKGEITPSPLEPIARFSIPKVLDLDPLRNSLLTNYIILDSFIGLEKGTTILSTGKTGLGKTSLAIDTIIAQTKLNKNLSRRNQLNCIYVCIGRSYAEAKLIAKFLNNYGAMKYTTIILADNNSTSCLQYLAAFSGCAMGDYWRTKEKSNSLVIYDDISAHFQAYLKTFGPESKVSINSIYSQLFEMSGQLLDSKGGSSLTSWPIFDCDFRSPWKWLFDMADENLMFNEENFNKKLFPPVQIQPIKFDVSQLMKKDKERFLVLLAKALAYIAFRTMEKATDELSIEKIGAKIFPKEEELVNQYNDISKKNLIFGGLLYQKRLDPLSIIEQCLILYTAINSYADDLPVQKITKFKTNLLSAFQSLRKKFKLEEGDNKSEQIIKDFSQFLKKL